MRNNNESILMFVLAVVSVIGLLYFLMVVKFVDRDLLYDISTFGNIMSVLILQVMVINTIFLSKITDQLYTANLLLAGKETKKKNKKGKKK